MVVNEEVLQNEVSKRMRTIIQSAEVPKINPNLPLIRYYRSLIGIHKTALSCLNEGSFQKALVLLTRFCSLAIEEVPKHPQFGSSNCEEKKLVYDVLKSSVAKAEEIKVLVRKQILEEVKRSIPEDIGRVREPSPIRIFPIPTEPSISQSDIPMADGNISYNDDLNPFCNEIKNPDIQTADITYPSISIITKNENPPKSSPAIVPHVFPKEKSMMIANDIIQKFMEASSRNTANNIETCGILCGNEIEGKYVITHVIVPKQSGSSDGCTANDEIEVFDMQKKHDLLTFGWIHTHPSQTAFLSSIDLHTHHAYQSSMSKAVAIVIAPKHNQIGTFVLTPEGMQTIGGCQERGFHTHPEGCGQLFRETDHAVYSETIKSTVLDLR